MMLHDLIIRIIASYLISNTTLYHLQLLNRRFYSIRHNFIKYFVLTKKLCSRAYKNRPPGWNKVYQFTLSRFPLHIDLNLLKNIHTLILYHCEYVSNVSALSHIHTLTLDDCQRVVDFSPLKTVHNLTLSEVGIRDVSVLSGVYSLTLAHCTNIVVLSGLSNVHYLNIKYTYSQLRTITRISNIHSLRLEGTSVQEISSFGNLHTLKLIKCPGIDDVSVFGNLHTLYLNNCTGITNVAGLENLQVLVLANCPGITDYSPVKKIPRLNIN